MGGGLPTARERQRLQHHLDRVAVPFERHEQQPQLETAQQVQHAPVGPAPLPHRAGPRYGEVHGIREALAPHRLHEQREGERLLQLHDEEVAPPDEAATSQSFTSLRTVHP